MKFPRCVYHHLLLRLPDKALHLHIRQPHAQQAKDDGDDPHVLHRAVMEGAQVRQQKAGRKRQYARDPVDGLGLAAACQVLQLQYPVARQRRIKAEHRHHRQEQHRTIQRHRQRGHGHAAHRPQIDHAPALVLLAALGRSQRHRRQQKAAKSARYVHHQQRLHPNRITVHRFFLLLYLNWKPAAGPLETDSTFQLAAPDCQCGPSAKRDDVCH